MLTPPVASVAQLSVDYRVGGAVLRALHEVTLDVTAGQRLAVVGESGSGKSTLGLAIMGLLPSNSEQRFESVTIAGTSVRPGDERAYRQVRGNAVSMVFQDARAALDPVRTVGSQIAEVLRVHSLEPRKRRAARVAELLHQVEIRNPEHVARQYPHELSGGMRQRAMIAAALAGRPRLLIADEPTSALDVTTQATVIELLGRLGETGDMSTMLITHDLALVAGFADTVAVLYAGELIEIGPVGRTYARPAHPYTRALLASIPSLDDPRCRHLGTIPGALPDLTAPVAGCVFEPRCPVGHGRAVCRQDRPSLQLMTDGGEVACHFPGELDDAERPETVAVVTVAKPPRAPVVTMDGVVKTFRRPRTAGFEWRGRTVAVAGVDLRVDSSCSVGVVGESGSGKTTLARVLIGLERADAGTICVPDGQSMRPVPELPRHYAQFVFQDPGDSLNPLMTVAEIIAEPLRLRDGRGRHRHSARVAELLDDVGLRSTMATRRPSELSGGQRQRVAIARALSTRPQLIIADEAVASLDMSARGQILNLLADLQREHGFAYLYISHDLSMVRHVCDRVVVMFGGRVVEVGDADAVFATPRHPYTQALIAAVPIPDPSRRQPGTSLIPPAVEVGALPATGCAYRARCPYAHDVCAEIVPVLDADADHAAACHFSDVALAAYSDRRSAPIAVASE